MYMQLSQFVVFCRLSWIYYITWLILDRIGINYFLIL